MTLSRLQNHEKILCLVTSKVFGRTWKIFYAKFELISGKRGNDNNNNNKETRKHSLMLSLSLSDCHRFFTYFSS